MASKTPPALPHVSGQVSKVFKTIEAFNEGYAGPNTKLLEKKSRDLAGRQDDFCIICGTHAEELFPQIGPKEVHLCPRQVCKSCWHIEAGWKRDSSIRRRSLKTEDGSGNVTVCCPLCWKRGWDFSSPLLGVDQPEWGTDADFSQKKDVVMPLRYRKWERAAKTKLFSWRRPLLTRKDDMTLESDRNLLRGMLKAFQKNPKRFQLFKGDVIEAISEEHVFNVADAFREHCGRLINSSSLVNSDEEASEEVVIQVKRGPGRPKRKSRPPGWYMVEEPIEPIQGTPTAATSLMEKSATPDTGGRPKRQAARLSFASGIPVQRTTTNLRDEEYIETPTPRSLKSRVRKIVVLPVSLPGSPESKKGVAETTALNTGRPLTSESDSITQPMVTDAAQDEAVEESRNETGEGRQSQASPQALRGNTPSLPLDRNDHDAHEQSGHTSTSQDLMKSQNTANAGPDEHFGQTNAQLLELQNKHTALQEDHDLLGNKYRRWRSGVVENAKLLFEQEEDLAAKKDIISDLSKSVKQLSSDNARLGAELALARGMVQYNPGLLKQTLLRSSLTPDVVDRLFSNPDFIRLLQPRPANGEVVPPQTPQNPDSARPKKRRRITAADALNDAEAEEARQKKLSRVIAPTIKRLEKSRFKLSAARVESVFDADTAESKRFLDSLIEFAKLPISFDEALLLIREAQQDRKQGRVVVPQLRLSDPAWAPWDVKTAQKRYMQKEGMVENENGEIVKKKPKSMEEMVADAKAVREATAKEHSIVEIEETMISDDDSLIRATDETQYTSASRRGGRSESQARRVWERHEELRREREQREQEEQRAALPPLDMTDPLQALAASMFTSVNGFAGKERGKAPGMNGSKRSGSPKQYQRRELSEDVEMEDNDEPMELSESP